MRVKSFYGNSIKEALDKARRELGADAAIVASRQLQPEEGRGCEVVCGIGEAEPVEVSRIRAEEPAGASVSPGKAGTGARATTSRIRKSIEALVKPPEDRFRSAELRASLLGAGFARDLADEIVAGVRQRQRRGSDVSSALPEELGARLRVSPQLGDARADRRVVAFAGPPGAGKTTSLVKLAVRYGLRSRKPMHIVSMDSWRIGGADALRTYAAGMAVSFETCETAAALSQSLEAHSGKGLVLIDTPGMGPNDVKAFAPLAALLSGQRGVEVQLVVPATLSPMAMMGAAKRFQAFLPSKLLITCADCVESCLAAIGLALTLDKAVSFVAAGQTIPDDIGEATLERLWGAREPSLSGGLKSAAG